jgi:hypothetical protein
MRSVLMLFPTAQTLYIAPRLSNAEALKAELPGFQTQIIN